MRALLGEAGQLDVADCIASVRRVIELGLAPADEQYLTGGSHGGFLVGNRKSLSPTPRCSPPLMR